MTCCPLILYQGIQKSFLCPGCPTPTHICAFVLSLFSFWIYVKLDFRFKQPTTTQHAIMKSSVIYVQKVSCKKRNPVSYTFVNVNIFDRNGCDLNNIMLDASVINLMPCWIQSGARTTITLFYIVYIWIQYLYSSNKQDIISKCFQ